jgi:hypothetical protein
VSIKPGQLHRGTQGISPASDNHALDALAKMDNVEVDEKANSPVTQLQVPEQLRVMNRKQLRD